MNIQTVDKVTENVIRRYISELQERGKCTFYANDNQKRTNYPERRRDCRKPISAAAIKKYIRKLWVISIESEARRNSRRKGLDFPNVNPKRAIYRKNGGASNTGILLVNK